MDKSIAGSQEYESPGFDPTQALPTAVLRDAFAGQLHDIEQASSWDTLAGKFYHTTGWLEALMLARVIDPVTYDALRAERLAGGVAQ